MTAGSDNPSHLFTEPKNSTSPQTSATDERSASFADALQTRLNDATDAPFYVDVPALSSEKKRKYQPLECSELAEESEDEDASKVVEIEGEYTVRDKRYLFARHGDGILRRKEAWEFRSTYPDLYAEFTQRKQRGELEPFDPSSTRIHPAHRLSIVLNINTRNVGVKKITRPAVDKDHVSDSEASDEESDEFEEEGSDDDDEYKGTRKLRARGTRELQRRTDKHSRDLPFGPKKTQRGGTSDTFELDDSDSEQGRPQRRSNRPTQKKNYTVNDDSDYEMELEKESSDYYEDEKPTRKAKRVVKRRGPRPAYGLIRNVEDLYDSDPETAPLRGHRDECERCHRAPAHILLKKRHGKKKKRKDDDDLSENDEEYYNKLGGWVRCLKCCVAAHWRCLASTQRGEILKAARAKAEAENDDAEGPPRRIKELEPDETTEFICGSCSKGGICMVCEEVAVEPESKPFNKPSADAAGDGMDVDDSETLKDGASQAGASTSGLEPAHELLFRCYTCKRLAHYSHLPVDEEDLTLAEVATYYQKENGWQCANCASYVFPVDKIIAWRPYPPNAVDPYTNSPETADYRENLPREYLIKWAGRSYRRMEWAPHMWVVATQWPRLKHFYENGPKIDLLESPTKDRSPAEQETDAEIALFAAEEDASRDVSVEADPSRKKSVGPPTALPDAELRIPPLWKTVDRVLDVLIWSPRRASKPSKKKGKSLKKKSKASKWRIEDEDSEDDIPPEAQAEYDAAFGYGDAPSDDFTETIDEYEERTGRTLREDDVGKVIWAFIKWDDLPYDEATWDSPPLPGSSGHMEFVLAFKYFILSRSVVVMKKSRSEIERFENRNGKKQWDSKSLGIPESCKYDIGQDEKLSLMPFQVDGVNWLCRNWFHQQQCILADEMGLGKTVQIITFLGILHARIGAFPSLVVVPNSTITNWVREFARWAPRLRVVPFYGDFKSKEIIKKYELQHAEVAPGTTGAKYHILVTTYETVTGQKDFNSVFKKTPRWEVLIVDEGQRLKSDSNLIFKRLNELNSCHRIIMTGTPLNNNIRELFNLMNFLNPEDWNDLEALAKQFEDLDEDRVKILHERLRPYFLRRVKGDVLNLPPKNEVIVPLSMAPLQKEVYKSILSKNVALLQSLTEASSARVNKAVAKRSNLRNMLMQLRKCLQHPYLIADDIEPKNLSPIEAHLKLIDASGKLCFLKMLLPKLKARGHRVLLFSQFVIALNIIEDFLVGEGYTFLRLDGDIKQAERQKSMDEFNRENSDVFIFILSTRAGGVGINLWSADTVIIFDPDFNPHQDLQAIARAHRFGQKKTCLVFKFMTKDSAEEKIVQAGKKKLVLDHLIVQKMDDNEDGDNVQSMLTFGAKALFEEGQGNRDITYSENDVEKLIEKIETEGDLESTEQSNNALAFAKVWSAHKDDLVELPEEVEDDADQVNSWAQTLQKIAEEQGRVEAREEAGRGVRRKAALVKIKYFEDVGSPKKGPANRKKRKLHVPGSSDDEYNLPPTRDASEALTTDASVAGTDNESLDPNKQKMNVDGVPSKRKTSKTMPRPSSERPFLAIHNQGRAELCGLCGNIHGSGGCPMTEKSENLAEYRRILIISEEESYKDRIEAVRAIDETLAKRGAIHLVAGQPLKPLRKQRPSRSKKSSNASLSAASSSSKPFSLMDEAGGSIRMPPDTGRPVRTVDEASVSRITPPFLVAFESDTKKSSNEELGSSLKGKGPEPDPAVKKAKLRSCEICKQTPFHQPAICSVVFKGPDSVTRTIARLMNEGGSQETLSALHQILRTQKKVIREQAQAIAGRPDGSTKGLVAGWVSHYNQ